MLSETEVKELLDRTRLELEKARTDYNIRARILPSYEVKGMERHIQDLGGQITALLKVLK